MNNAGALEPGGWAARAEAAIPQGASTGSKRAGAIYGANATDEGAHASESARGYPTHFVRASGCEVTTADGRTLLDCTMALGAVAFGYADAEVNGAVVAAVSAGNVCGLSPTLEVEVAERLIDIVPCAEQVRFLKSGAEASTAAVRLARAATGRSRVIASGYFGWHDWSNPGSGVPAGASADVVVVPFDDVVALEREAAHAGGDLAAIVLEPVVHEVASLAWLRAARALCDQLGAVLIFDEIKTAFRVHVGGVQALLNVRPDLTSVGKAMANGFPLAAVVGIRSVMESANGTWISSTLASETSALAAAAAVLDRHDREDVCRILDARGQRLRDALSAAMRKHGIAIAVEGPNVMQRLVSIGTDEVDRLVGAAAAQGVLLKRGAYLFPALAHTDSVLLRIAERLDAACLDLSRTRT